MATSWQMSRPSAYHSHLLGGTASGSSQYYSKWMHPVGGGGGATKPGAGLTSYGSDYCTPSSGTAGTAGGSKLNGYSLPSYERQNSAISLGNSTMPSTLSSTADKRLGPFAGSNGIYKGLASRELDSGRRLTTPYAAPAPEEIAMFKGSSGSSGDTANNIDSSIYNRSRSYEPLERTGRSIHQTDSTMPSKLDSNSAYLQSRPSTTMGRTITDKGDEGSKVVGNHVPHPPLMQRSYTSLGLGVGPVTKYSQSGGREDVSSLGSSKSEDSKDYSLGDSSRRPKMHRSTTHDSLPYRSPECDVITGKPVMTSRPSERDIVTGMTSRPTERDIITGMTSRPGDRYTAGMFPNAKVRDSQNLTSIQDSSEVHRGMLSQRGYMFNFDHPSLPNSARSAIDVSGIRNRSISYRSDQPVSVGTSHPEMMNGYGDSTLEHTRAHSPLHHYDNHDTSLEYEGMSSPRVSARAIIDPLASLSLKHNKKSILKKFSKYATWSGSSDLPMLSSGTIGRSHGKRVTFNLNH